MSMLHKELHSVDIVRGKAQARVGLELQLVVQRVLIQQRMSLTQSLDHLQNRLEQRVFTDTTAKLIQSRGCCPVRDGHKYTSPCVLMTRNS